jgi:tetratricopeptide (TPR) repeat protein
VEARTPHPEVEKAEARVLESSSPADEVEALAELARRCARAGDHRRAAEALTATLDHEDARAPDARARLRIARLHFLAGQLDLARDWLDRARWIDPEDPELGAELARIAVAQRDPVGIEDAEASAPVAAARAWIALEQPARAARLLSRLRDEDGESLRVRADVAAREGDGEVVRGALEAALGAHVAAGDALAAFLVGSALLALGGGDAGTRRRLAVLRPALVTEPRRSLSSAERARLGIGEVSAIAGPEAPEPAARAARGVARLLGCALVSRGRAGGDLGRLRCAWARDAAAGATPEARGRLALVAAVDPGPTIASAPPGERLGLAARVLDPEHRALLDALGLGLDIPRER